MPSVLTNVPEQKSVALNPITNQGNLVDFMDYSQMIRQISDLFNDIYNDLTKVVPHYAKLIGPLVYKVLDADYILAPDCTNGDSIIQLTPASKRKFLLIKRLDQTANTLTIKQYGSDTIDGSKANLTLNPGDSVTLVSDADRDWLSLSSAPASDLNNMVWEGDGSLVYLESENAIVMEH